MTIRTAVIGLGWAGQSIWLPGLADHPDFRVVAVVDPVPERLADRPGPAPGVQVHADAGTLDAKDVDLAIVAVPNHAHVDVAAGLLARGITVFLEKPVCVSRAEADRLSIAERDGAAMLLAGSAARHRSDVGALTALMPQLGTVRHVDLSWVRARGIPDADWFTRRELSGGGVLVDLGWHLLDVLKDLLGPVTVEQLAASVTDDFLSDAGWRASWRHDQPGERPPGDVEDTVRAFFVTGAGVSVALHASWASHCSLDVTSIQVEGTAGTADLHCTFGFSPNRRNGSSLQVTRSGMTHPVPLADEPIGSEYRRQLDLISAEVTRAGSRGEALDDARHTVDIVERIYHDAGRAHSLAPAR